MPERSFTKITKDVYSSQKLGKYCGNVPSYIKLAHDSNPDSLIIEKQSYELLSNHLKMPKIKMWNLNGLGNSLIVKEAGGENLRSMYSEGRVDEVINTLDVLYEDIFRMWENTKKPLKEEDLSLNSRFESIRTLQRLQDYVFNNPDFDKEMVVNGKIYPSIIQTYTEVMNNLSSLETEKYMVLSHNDEHFGNIFSFENDYKIIDPRNSGYNFASQAINITIGSTLIFMTEFDFQEKNLDFNRVYINYTLPENAKKVYQFMLSKYLEQEEFAKNSILPELLFTNFFRAFCNVVNPKNFNVVEKNRTAILGQSIEIYSAVKNQLKNQLK